MRTVGTAVRSCQTRSAEKVIVLAGWIEVAKFFLWLRWCHCCIQFETSLPIIVLQFVSTCLLPVPTDVFLRHGRVEKEVGVLEESRDRGGTPALQRCFGQVLLRERYFLKTHQSPLVKGNSSCSVHVGSEKDSFHIHVILSNAYTLQKVGRSAQSRCPVWRDGSHWRFRLDRQRALAVATYICKGRICVKSELRRRRLILTLKNWPQGTPRISISSLCAS